MPSKTAKQNPVVNPDPATNVGYVQGAGLTEDQKRAAGVDASADAGPHSDAPEDNAGSGTGTVLDTYAPGMTVEHANVSGPTTDLVVGQVPVVPAWPMRGSRASNERYNPNIPNAINRSPVIRGVSMDARNDPAHPDHKSADPKHPDYGYPAAQHAGIRTVGKTYEELELENGNEPAPQARTEEPAPAV
jgi:hypothetical protein